MSESSQSLSGTGSMSASSWCQSLDVIGVYVGSFEAGGDLYAFGGEEKDWEGDGSC